MYDAIEYMLYGKKQDTKKYVNKDELEIVAYHESGHALIGLLLKEASEVTKLTVVPRSKGMLGFTKTVNRENKRLYSKGELLAEILVLMGGRAAEEVIFQKNSVTTGASNDIKVLNDIARKIITVYGMSSSVGLIYEDSERGVLEKDKVEREISSLLKVCYGVTMELLRKNLKILKDLKRDVMKSETQTLDHDYFNKLQKKISVHENTSELIEKFVVSNKSLA